MEVRCLVTRVSLFSFSEVNDPKGIRNPVNRRLAEHEAAPIKDADEGAVAVALGRRSEWQ